MNMTPALAYCTLKAGRQNGEQPSQRRRLAGRDLLVHDQVNAGDTEQQAEPLPRQHPLAEPAIGQRRGQHRLQADHQRDQAGRQPVLDRSEHAAEIETVHQGAGHGAVE
jgi:hypothetical protein